MMQKYLQCDNTFKPFSRGGHKKVYCSKPCGDLYYWSHHREEHVTKGRQRYKANAVRLREEGKKRWRDNHEVMTAQHRAAYYRHRDKRLDEHRKYYINHRDKILASVYSWQSEHKHLVNQYKKKNGLSRRSAFAGSIDMAAWAKKLKRLGGRCQLCGSTERISIDHILPIAKGGSNEIRNLQPLCIPCNCRKNAKILPGVQMSLITPTKNASLH